MEFQKRGLPHAHILIWLDRKKREVSPALIDSFISASIPDPVADPLGYVLVSEHMIHDPCREDGVKCPCQISGSGRPSRFEHWGARGDHTSSLHMPLRLARI